MTFLMKKFKNQLYNHHHLISFDRPLGPTIRLKHQENKEPYPNFRRRIHFSMVSERLGHVKMAKNHVFNEKSMGQLKFEVLTPNPPHTAY